MIKGRQVTDTTIERYSGYWIQKLTNLNDLALIGKQMRGIDSFKDARRQVLNLFEWPWPPAAFVELFYINIVFAGRISNRQSQHPTLYNSATLFDNQEQRTRERQIQYLDELKHNVNHAVGYAHLALKSLLAIHGGAVLLLPPFASIILGEETVSKGDSILTLILIFGLGLLLGVCGSVCGYFIFMNNQSREHHFRDYDIVRINAQELPILLTNPVGPKEVEAFTSSVLTLLNHTDAIVRLDRYNKVLSAGAVIFATCSILLIPVAAWVAANQLFQ